MENLTKEIIPGDVILTNGRNFEWGSLPIKIANFFSRGYKERGWTHAALYIGNGNVVEAFPGGIVQRNFADSYLSGKYNLLILRHKKASEEAIKKAIDFCIHEEGAKYDWRALTYFLLFNFLPVGLHFIIDNDFIGARFNVNDSYFCSELVASGFKEADAYCFEREPYKVMPIDFNNYLWFDIVDKIDLPKIENQTWHKVKIVVFYSLYLFAAIIFPLITILLGILVIVVGIAFSISAIVALSAIISGALTSRKKTEKSIKK